MTTDSSAKQADPEWPTPSFDRADAMYTCSKCTVVVDPKANDKQAALLIAGETRKLCAECAEEIREMVR